MKFNPETWTMPEATGVDGEALTPVIKAGAHRNAIMAGHHSWPRGLKELMTGETLPAYGTFVVYAPQLNVAVAVEPGLNLTEITSRLQKALREFTGDKKLAITNEWSLRNEGPRSDMNQLINGATSRNGTITLALGEVSAY